MSEAMELNEEGLSERQLVTFHLGNDEFGADIMHVREIIRLTDITKVPHAPAFVEGVCNLRGNILPIIDGRVRLGLPRRQQDESTRVLVVDVRGRATGIVVDRVSEVLRVSADYFEAAPPVIRNIDIDYLDSMVKLDGGKRIIIALDIGKILTVEQLDQLKTEGAAAVAAVQENKAKAIEIEEEQLVTFLLGPEEYAFNIMHVKEIIRVQQITAVPNVPQYIEGVVSLRDQLLPIINMPVFFNLPNSKATDQSRIIVVDLGKITAGFRVDKVSEVVSVPKSLIEPPPLVYAGDESAQILGVAKLKQGKRLIMYLNAANLLPVEIVRELAAEAGQERERYQESAKTVDEEQLVAFRVENEEFAIKITDVQEINRMAEITHMPGAPAYVDGLVNLRGNIIPALNLRRRFALPERSRDDATRVIIVDTGSRKTGIVVDAVSEVLRFDRSLVEATPDIVSASIDTKYISGVGKLNQGKRMVMILDLAQVLRFEIESKKQA